MTDGNVAHLKTVPSIPQDVSNDTFLAHVKSFLSEHEILTEYEHSDVELDGATSDERRLGELTMFEKECFVIGNLIGEIVREELIEIEASGTDKIAEIMRAERVPMATAAQRYAQSNEVPEESRAFLNKCAVTQGNLMSAYEWSVRQRHDMFLSHLIVRSGFIAHAYG
jgi:hypothetical protein